MKKLLSMIMAIMLVSALVLGGCAKKETKKAAPTPLRGVVLASSQ